MFESAYNGAYKELKIIYPQCFLHVYRTSNDCNFLVFCLHKNTKLQSETNMLATLAVYNIGYYNISSV